MSTLASWIRATTRHDPRFAAASIARCAVSPTANRTMVSPGVLAAPGLRPGERHWSGFRRYRHRAPYVSAALIVFVGLYTGWTGLHELMT